VRKSGSPIRKFILVSLLGALSGFLVTYAFFSTPARMEAVDRAWRSVDAHRDDVKQELIHAERRLEQARQRLKDTEDEERQQDEERKMMQLYWDSVEHSSHCAAYGTRYYSAELKNLPNNRGFDSIKACYKTPIFIHGFEYSTPSWCSAEWGGNVVGHWRVTNDVLCKPWWSRLTDKGCTERGSGKRRWEQHMENLYAQDDWAQICESMPADFNGKHFDRPSYCANWGQHGIFGAWIVEDDRCR
jgi:hypothetical protein